MPWPVLAQSVNRDLVGKEHIFSSWDTPLILLAFIGFVMAVAGHLFQVRTLITAGIGFIFMAVLLFPILLYVRGHP